MPAPRTRNSGTGQLSILALAQLLDLLLEEREEVPLVRRELTRFVVPLNDRTVGREREEIGVPHDFQAGNVRLAGIPPKLLCGRLDAHPLRNVPREAIDPE